MRDREDALKLAWDRIASRGPWKTLGDMQEAIADVMLEARALEADWWVEDLALGGNDLDGDNQHLRNRAAKLRAQVEDLEKVE